jgi:hypothetical protein
MTPSVNKVEAQVLSSAEFRQALMEGGKEVFGPREADRLFARLNGAPCGGLSAVHSLLQADFGLRGGQGAVLRLGRASFRSAMPAWTAAAGLSGMEFRLRPSPRRIRAALLALGALLGEPFGARVTLTEDAACWSWRVTACPACRERVSSAPDCHLLTGVLQETLTWAGAGRTYRVRELECSAAGAPACLFQVDKKPLD